ncbi:MAG: hypothetical protein CSA50_02585 [Gammaproteobacteria bacterium]|nr:MAG: hypothetical protein CSA50_02585 [Gammaproteobacteria bacterium]
MQAVGAGSVASFLAKPVMPLASPAQAVSPVPSKNDPSQNMPTDQGGQSGISRSLIVHPVCPETDEPRNALESPQSHASSQIGAEPLVPERRYRSGSRQNQQPNQNQEDKKQSTHQYNGVSLTPEDIEVVKQLKSRDREVRLHELRHQSVGGQYAGSANFLYQAGPDGIKYAVAGEVSISISEVPNDPRATIEKMRIVCAAALAPAEPSAQDRAVASEATRIMLKAQRDLASQTSEERSRQREQQVQNDQARTWKEIERSEKSQENRLATANDMPIYTTFIRLGQQYQNGSTSGTLSLDEVV